MILRKPYAILIKNFKLLHAILAFFIGYLVYRTNNILSFISDYIGSSKIKVDNEIISSLFSPILFLVIAIVILFTGIVMAVLNLKKKPIKFYIYNIIAHLYVLIIYIASASIIKELQFGLVEVKTLKLVQDFLTAGFGIQIVALVIVIIRAVGFDIKGFNFKEDLAELEIESTDNEEFEVNLNIDTDKLKRNTRKKLRYAKYVYLENMFFINIVLVSFIIITTIFSLANINVYSKTYKKTETFKTNEFMIQTNEAFLTKYDYKGTKITDDTSIVAIRIKVRKLYGKKDILKTGRIILRTNNHNYYHITEYNDELKDLGNTYLNSKISTKLDEYYLLVFEVNDLDLEKKMQLRYTDTTGDVVKITVIPNNLDKNEKIKSSSLGAELKMDESVFENTILKIDNYEINDSFKIDYKYKVSDKEYDALEYVNVSASGNYDKTLLKLVGTITYDENLPIIKSNNLFTFMEKYVTIRYKTNDKEKLVSIKFKRIKPQKVSLENTYFIEVPNYLKNATNISLEINVRNKVYDYILK